MQLTKHTDYAFRALIYLALNNDERLVTVQEISDKFDMSRSHVMKIVNQLATAGVIHSIRGKQGGLKLGMAPEKINLRRVIELMEVTLSPVNCDKPACPIVGSCTLRGVLWQAQAQYLEHVEKYTLADLVTSAKPLRLLLASHA